MTLTLTSNYPCTTKIYIHIQIINVMFFAQSTPHPPPPPPSDDSLKRHQPSALVKVRHEWAVIKILKIRYALAFQLQYHLKCNFTSLGLAWWVGCISGRVSLVSEIILKSFIFMTVLIYFRVCYFRTTKALSGGVTPFLEDLNKTFGSCRCAYL